MTDEIKKPVDFNILLNVEKYEIQQDASEVLLKFLRGAITEDKHVFRFRVMPGTAAAFIQRMRTELSRQRKRQKDNGVTMRYFKMLHEGTECTDNYDEVTLKYHQSDANKDYELIDEMGALLRRDFNKGNEND